ADEQLRTTRRSRLQRAQLPCKYNGIRLRPRAPAGLRLLLGVVLLAVDTPALAVLLALEAPLLVGTDLPICAGARLRCIVACLAALEPGRFPVCQLARCDALLDDVALDGAGLGKGAAAEEGCGDGSQFEFHLDVPLRWSAMPFNAAAREVEYRTPP